MSETGCNWTSVTHGLQHRKMYRHGVIQAHMSAYMSTLSLLDHIQLATVSSTFLWDFFYAKKGLGVGTLELKGGVVCGSIQPAWATVVVL